MGRRYLLTRAAAVALIVARCCVPLARAVPVLDAEMDALESLASAWSKFNGTKTWSSGSDCDTMHSVFCDEEGHVVAIRLDSNLISGTVPSSLGSLVALVNLSPVPPPHPPLQSPPSKLSCLSTPSAEPHVSQVSMRPSRHSATALALSVLDYNELTGQIPDSLSELTNLEGL
ncbi:unnamed protein product [Closterium sp. NIES-64]|nr:unnamed protein product [Closterium sp. NIES-64]